MKLSRRPSDEGRPAAARAAMQAGSGEASPKRLRRGGGSPMAARSRVALALGISLLALGACRQDMHNQPKYIPLRSSDFFTNGSSARPLPDDTVARGTLQDDAAFYTGKAGTTEIDTLPFPITKEVLDRGQERFNIYCAPCHDRTGSGRGMIVQRGYRQPPSYHLDRLRQVPIGHFYDVMTNGFGAMPDYRAQVQPRDRWAIAAYIRALQLSQNAKEADVSQADRAKLSETPEQQAGEGAARR
jgi:mono/diheme cytochrome c family protein